MESTTVLFTFRKVEYNSTRLSLKLQLIKVLVLILFPQLVISVSTVSHVKQSEMTEKHHL